MSNTMMIDTFDSDRDEDKDKSSYDCDSEDFRNYEEYPDEDDDPEDIQIVLTEEEKAEYTDTTSFTFNVDEGNKIQDLVRKQFATDADEFIQAVGEDNIFMSGLEWLPGQEKVDKRKFVRTALD